jgi:hypothetical protein
MAMTTRYRGARQNRVRLRSCVLCGKPVSPADHSAVEEIEEGNTGDSNPSPSTRLWHKACFEQHLDEGEEC